MLAVHGLDVVSASAYSADGHALSEFGVSDPLPGRDTVEPRIEHDLGTLALDGRFAVRHAYHRARTPNNPQEAEATWRDADHRRAVRQRRRPRRPTVIDVHTSDGIGVLYRITPALTEFDVDIRSARVQTLGNAGGRRVHHGRQPRARRSKTSAPKPKWHGHRLRARLRLEIRPFGVRSAGGSAEEIVVLLEHRVQREHGELVERRTREDPFGVTAREPGRRAVSFVEQPDTPRARRSTSVRLGEDRTDATRRRDRAVAPGGEVDVALPGLDHVGNHRGPRPVVGRHVGNSDHDRALGRRGKEGGLPDRAARHDGDRRHRSLATRRACFIDSDRIAGP